MFDSIYKEHLDGVYVSSPPTPPRCSLLFRMEHFACYVCRAFVDHQ